MKVAFIGQKGIPAVFGGVEAHVDELSRELVRRGLEVSVYVRNWYTPLRLKSVQGVRLVHVPTLRTKHLDAAVHCFLASIHVLFTDAELIHYEGIGPALFSWIPRLAGRKVAATIHRLDWAAEKWGAAARFVLKRGERAAVVFPHRTIAVSDDLRRVIRARHGKETVVIPNGIPPSRPRPLARVAARFGLSENRYCLFMGRLVPEKRPDWIIKAYGELKRRREWPESVKIVIAGGSSETDAYVRSLKKAAEGDPRVIFPGYVQGEDKEELLSHALVFLLPSRLEGHPIALLEAESYGRCCLVSDIPAHREIISDRRDGLFFRTDDFEDFLAKLREVISHPVLAAEMGRRAKDSLASNAGWDGVAEKTLALYRELRPEARGAAARRNPL